MTQTTEACAPPASSRRAQRVVCGAFEAAGVDNPNPQLPDPSDDDTTIILKLSVAGPTSQAAPDAYNAESTNNNLHVAQQEQGCSDASCAHSQLPLPSAASTAQSSGLGAPSLLLMDDASALASAHPPSGPALPATPQQVHPLAHAHGGASSLQVVRLLAAFEEKGKSGEWPCSTTVHCYWCCHRFASVPFGLPVKYTADTFHVVGCFCSLECAAAYNFASGKDSMDDTFNRYSLLNALSARLGLGRVVRLAPDRLALRIFGGHLGIDEFRAFTSSGRQILVNWPPMQTITQQLEEVHENDVRSEYKYIPLDAERVNRYAEKVRLKRSKPLVNFKNTLEHSMKLRFGVSAGTAAAGRPAG